MSRDLFALVDQLDLDEKATLLAGADIFSMAPLERHGIPPDPGHRRPQRRTRTGAPRCAGRGGTAALDLRAVRSRAGRHLGPGARRASRRPARRQARTKAAGCCSRPPSTSTAHPSVVATSSPTPRTRSWPAGWAPAYVRGAQSAGVACTVKHFAGNEYEKDRMVTDSIIDERALRELHLLPFELAVKEGGALGVMTAYNRLNGPYCPDNHWLLRDLFRGDGDSTASSSPTGTPSPTPGRRSPPDSTSRCPARAARTDPGWPRRSAPARR